MERQLRVSFIEFLNALPLGWGFLHGSQQDRFELVFDVPSQCARHLASGEVDVGLIPVIEYLRIPDLSVIPGISIASQGSVKSVLFVSKRPIEEVREVAVDTSSRTSTALLRILLSKFYGRPEVDLRDTPPNAERMLAQSEAALLIGNAALKLNLEGLYVYDLAREWNRFTGLPFVFAFWAVRGGVDLGSDIESFYISREEGLEAIDQMAEIYSRKLAISGDEIRSYLRSNLDYSLDPRNLEGLKTFFEYGVELGIAPQMREIQFPRS